MANAKLSAAGKAALANILSKLPEEKRAAVQAEFDAAEEAIEALGESTLSRSDYNRSLDELKAKEDTLNEWWTSHEGYLREYQQIKPEYDKLKAAPPVPNPNPNPNPAPPAGFTKDEILKDWDQRLTERERAYAPAMGLMTSLSTRHLHEFGEVLDDSLWADLMSDRRMGQVVNGRQFGLREAYEDKFKDRYQEKAKVAEETRLTKLKQEWESEYVKTHQSSAPYPISANVPSGSPLDGLAAKSGEGDVAQRAADQYNEIVRNSGLG